MKNILFLLLACAIVVTSACLGQGSNTAQASSPITKGGPYNPLPLESEEVTKQSIFRPTDKVVEIKMVARNFEFDPASVTVRKGDKVRLKITSIDIDHGIGIPDYSINEWLYPNQETTIEFVADKPGTFTFYCSVFCGSGHGRMQGTLIVQE